MTQYNFPENDVGGDRLYDAEDFKRFFAAFLKTGVVNSFGDGLLVQSAQNGMNIQVGIGSAVINGGTFMNDAPIGIQVNVASAIQNRTDSVVLRADKDLRSTYLFYKPNDTTVVRNETVFELQLATVSVRMNASQITDADISDSRSNPDVCGWSTPFDNINVDGLIQQYQAIFSQKEAEFDDWFINLVNQLSENQATNLQNQITTIDSGKNIGLGLISDIDSITWTKEKHLVLSSDSITGDRPYTGTFYLEVVTLNSGTLIQKAYPTDIDQPPYYRTYKDSIWTDWRGYV
jgi:hypothetical protein